MTADEQSQEWPDTLIAGRRGNVFRRQESSGDGAFFDQGERCITH